MKKVLFTLFATSLLMTVAGCKKDGVDVVFPEPATKAEAVSVFMDKGQDLKLVLPDRAKPSDPSSAQPSEPVEVRIPVLELTEGNRYVLYIDEKTKANFNKPLESVWTGKYVYEQSTKTYKLDRFGEIQLDDNLLVFRPNKDLSVKAAEPEMRIACTINRMTTASTALSNLARTWKVASSFIKIKGGKDEIEITKGFTGCDLYEIARFLKSKNVSLSDSDVDSLRGYNITEMYLAGSGSIIINFADAEAYYGNFQVDSKFNFSWELNDSNKLIAAKADGSVSFPRNNSAEISMNMTVTAGNETYSGLVTFNLEEVNN